MCKSAKLLGRKVVALRWGRWRRGWLPLGTALAEREKRGAVVCYLQIMKGLAVTWRNITCFETSISSECDLFIFFFNCPVEL